MLEKIGLPPKPSLRGNNWVDDASHCQGCSSAFTFINRKHHCRRCGGLFCNSCTQQRMVLRGQGDSPVRICEPCKKLEEASRFEMRYGHKNRSGRGGSKLTTKSEDEVLNQILSNEGKTPISSRSASTIDINSSDQLPTSSASGSNIQGTLSQDDRGGICRSISNNQPTGVSTAATNASPEELRQQAMEEKKKYRTLKAEGKPEEALAAFKRGKELERDAAALEINLRKNRRKASSLSNTSELSDIKNNAKASSLENRISSQRNKEKDDFSAELREMGWSDMDFRDADKKPAAISLEGELSKLIGEVSQGANTESGAHGIDKSEVIAHKRKALELKRQGKLTEAKEELKRAKVLEKQIEEQELLGEDEESDEELSSLIRSVNFDKLDDSSIGYNLDHGLDFDNFGGLDDDLGADDDLEVTLKDMHDPDMLAALQSLGWTDETTDAKDLENQFGATDSDALVNEIQSLKKEALNQKKAGNSKEALALFRKAKLLEKELESSNYQGTNLVTDNSVIPSESLEIPVIDKIASKSKSMIRNELLDLKKRALALRREGKLDESEEELKKGKVLEKRLEEMENAPKVRHTTFGNKQTADSMINDVVDEEVTEQDMNDPTYLSLLKTLGWSDDVNETHQPSLLEKDVPTPVRSDSTSNIQAAASDLQASVSRKSESEIRRELLGLKRKSLALRRQGEVVEAEEVLKMAKVLEARLAEIEAATQKEFPIESSEHKEYNVVHAIHSPVIDLGSTGLVTAESPVVTVHSYEKQSALELIPTQETLSQNDEHSLQEDILAHKRKALALKRDGKLVEAKEELLQAKLLEKRLGENQSQPEELQGLKKENKSQSNELLGLEKKEIKTQANISSNDKLSGSDVSSAGKKDSSPNSAPKPLSSRDRFKLQRESLNHKRQSLKLRREGRTEEADAEFELAKAIEAQLEESTAHDSSASQSVTGPVGDVVVEDFLDPQLFSALKAIGMDDVGSGSRVPEEHEPKKQITQRIDKSNEDRVHLEEQIKAEKIKAFNFKRSGKQAEALDALRTAKLLEKKLNSLAAK